MTQNWFAYWWNEEVDKALDSQTLPHATSNQLNRVAVGDIVWIVTARPGANLVTIGPIKVGGKSKLRGSRKWRVSGRRGTVIVPKEVSLRSILNRISFDSKQHPRLRGRSRAAMAQQLQAMRRLTGETSVLLRRTWQSGSSRWREDLRAAARKLAKDEVGNREVLARARKEQGKLRQALLRGRRLAPCFICGDSFPARLLVAAHIKPRHRCSEKEMADQDNVVLMCALGCDSLFGNGFIAVKKNTLLAHSGPTTAAVSRVLKRITKQWAGTMSIGRARFLAWHAAHAGW